jgi:hypothetical protein
MVTKDYLGGVYEWVGETGGFISQGLARVAII